MSDQFRIFGDGPEGIPSNDPEQRGDADGDGFRPAVNRDPFSPKRFGGRDPGYGLDLGDGFTSVDSLPVRTVDNLPSSSMPNDSSKRPPRKSKGYPSVLD